VNDSLYEISDQDRNSRGTYFSLSEAEAGGRKLYRAEGEILEIRKNDYEGGEYVGGAVVGIIG
jgi:hypothetical protein